VQRQQEMRIDVAPCLLDVGVRPRRVVRTVGRDQHVLDRRGQCIEESRESVEVCGIEGGDACPKLEADAVDPLGVSRRDNHVGSVLARMPGGLEPDAELPPITTSVWPASCPIAPHAPSSTSQIEMTTTSSFTHPFTLATPGRECRRRASRTLGLIILMLRSPRRASRTPWSTLAEPMLRCRYRQREEV